MAKEFDSFLGSKYKAYLSIGADKGLKPGTTCGPRAPIPIPIAILEAGLSLKATEYEDTQ